MAHNHHGGITNSIFPLFLGEVITEHDCRISNREVKRRKDRITPSWLERIKKDLPPFLLEFGKDDCEIKFVKYVVHLKE